MVKNYIIDPTLAQCCVPDYHRQSNGNKSGGHWPNLVHPTPTDQPLPDVSLTQGQRCLPNVGPMYASEISGMR